MCGQVLRADGRVSTRSGCCEEAASVCSPFARRGVTSRRRSGGRPRILPPTAARTGAGVIRAVSVHGPDRSSGWRSVRHRPARRPGPPFGPLHRRRSRLLDRALRPRRRPRHSPARRRAAPEHPAQRVGEDPPLARPSTFRSFSPASRPPRSPAGRAARRCGASATTPSARSAPSSASWPRRRRQDPPPAGPQASGAIC